MTLRLSFALRVVFIVFFIGLELLVIFMTLDFIRTNQLGTQEILMLIGTALLGCLGLIMLRLKLIIGDNYVEYHYAAPWSKVALIRAVDVEKIERSAAPFMGRVDYVRMKGGRELHPIFTDGLERRKEVPALLEKALHTKIIE